MPRSIALIVFFALLVASSTALANGNGDETQFVDISPHVVDGELVKSNIDNYTATEGSTFENLYELEQPSFVSNISTDSEVID